jgi:hypothetical protein
MVRWQRFGTDTVKPIGAAWKSSDLGPRASAYIIEMRHMGSLGLEIAFAPLALFRRARPWIWSAMLCLHLGLLLLISFPDLTAGMVLLHLFTFNPAWLRGERHFKRVSYLDFCIVTPTAVVAVDSIGARGRAGGSRLNIF